MSKESYQKLLRDPRWQKKRLEIMNRDGFQCVDCGAEDKTLNVHHLYYGAGLAPWEYENSSLVTLCEECHEIEHGTASQSERDFLQTLKSVGFRSNEMGSAAYFLGLHKSEIGAESVLQSVRNAHEVLFWAGSDEEASKELADFVALIQTKYRAKHA